MKQKLISFLDSTQKTYVGRIEDNYATNNPAIVVYPICNFFPQRLLMALIKFANNNGYVCYIEVFYGEVRMRIFDEIKS